MISGENRTLANILIYSVMAYRNIAGISDDKEKKIRSSFPLDALISLKMYFSHCVSRRVEGKLQSFDINRE